MIVSRNYYSKVEHCRRYGLPDVCMMITKIIVVKLGIVGDAYILGCSHDDVKKLL
jgi:hypothetical protein